MTDRIVEMSGELVERAIDMLADASAVETGRPVEYCRRRMRAAVELVAEGDRSHPYWDTHFPLAMKVIGLASNLEGRDIDAYVKPLN